MNLTKNSRVLPLLFLLLIAQSSFGQLNEGRMWLGFAAGKLITDVVEVELEQQLRLDSDFGQISQTFTEVGVNWEVADQFELSGSYRLSFQTDDLLNRFSAKGTYTYKAKPWYLNLRMTIQEDLFRTSLNETNLRYKAQLRYRINKRWSLYTGAETWTRAFPETEGLTRVRYSFGGRYSRKINRARLFYSYQHGYAGEIDESAHIISLKYALKFD